MTKRDKKHVERKVRASDFAMYHTVESRPTGLHQIFDAFQYDLSSSSKRADASLAAHGEAGTASSMEASTDILKALDKLTKKDGSTKLKSLEALESLLEAAPDYVIEAVLHDFMHVFKRLAIVEPMRKIRLMLGTVLCKIASTLKRRMQSHMEAIVTHWFFAMHDDAPDVAAAYVEAFQSLFSTPATIRQEKERKTFRVLTHYVQKIASTSSYLLSRDIESYKKDWMEVFGKACDNSATISEIHNRLICTILHSLTDLMRYQREYGEEQPTVDVPVAVFLTTTFVDSIASLCRSSSYKQRLYSTRLMVEMVKVLRDEHLHIAKSLFKIGVQRLYSAEEASVAYHHVRLICACARYNRRCWEPLVLQNYSSFLNAVLDSYNGDFSATIELYSLFPCLVSYLPQDWLRSTEGTEETLKVTHHLLELMKGRVSKNYESSFTFDPKLFSKLGSSMLYCYYRILLILEDSCDSIMECAFLPLVELQSGDYTAQLFLTQMPRIFTEFIEESVVFRSSDSLEKLLTFLHDMNGKKHNLLLMAKVFAEIGKPSQSPGGHQERHDKLKDYASSVETQLKEQMANYDLPPLLMSFLENTSSVSFKKKLDDMLTVLEGTHIQAIATDSPIFDVKNFISHKFADAWSFENAVSTLSRALVIYRPMIEEPLNYFSADTDACVIVLLSLLALQGCGSSNIAFRIGTTVYSLPLNLNEGNNMALMLKFIQSSEEYNKVLSEQMLSWLMTPCHINVITCEAVYSCIDESSLSDHGKALYALLHASLHLIHRKSYNSYATENQPIVNEVVSLYLVGYYMNLPLDLETLLRFCIGMLPAWTNGTYEGSDKEILSFVDHLKDKQMLTPKGSKDHDLYSTKDVVNAVLSIQGNPCRATRSISRVITALASLSTLDITRIFSRNAVLFASLWLINCEKYLIEPALEEGGASPSLCTKETVECFADVFVMTLVNTGFSCRAFEKLTDKLLELHRCRDIITEAFARHISSTAWSSVIDLENKNKLMHSYLSKAPASADVMCEVFKKMYKSNNFMGRFLGTIYEVNNNPTTVMDELIVTLRSCTDTDVNSFLNCVTEITHLLNSAICVTDELHRLKNQEDCDYLTVMMVEVPTMVFERLGTLEQCDTTSRCWLHHGLIAFFKSCIDCMKSIEMEAQPFLNLVAGIWLMRALKFCYTTNLTYAPVGLELIAELLNFSLSEELTNISTLQPRRDMYEYSKEGAMDYLQVLEALSNENLARVLESRSLDLSMSSVDSHYFLVMVVHMIEQLDEFFRKNELIPSFLQGAKAYLKTAIYEFLKKFLKSETIYSYFLCLISRLWRYDFLLSDIAKYSGTLGISILERGEVIFALPSKFISTFIEDKRNDPVVINVSQLLFNILHDPENSNEDYSSEKDEEPQTPTSQISELTKHNGTKAIEFCMNLFLGPYLSESLFKFYGGSLDPLTWSSQDMEQCLTAWLSVFTMFQNLKQDGNLTIYNALGKVLTVKPSDAGEALWETIAAEVAANNADESDKCISAWWLQTSATIRETTDDSVLHRFVQMLMLCTEGLLHQEGAYLQLLKTLYYKVSRMFPEEVNHMWNHCKNSYVKKQIMKLTKEEITQKIIAEEMDMLKRCKSTSLQFSHDAEHRNVYVSLVTKAEIPIKLTVKIPSAFPLEPLSFVSQDDVGSFKGKHLRWLMMAQSTANRSGLSQGLLLWSENITNFFDGIEECPICYSIVHVQFNTIPGKSCKVCKHKFHTECLYKWFRNAQKAKCPLCQSHVSFSNYN